LEKREIADILGGKRGAALWAGWGRTLATLSNTAKNSAIRRKKQNEGSRLSQIPGGILSITGTLREQGGMLSPPIMYKALFQVPSILLSPKNSTFLKNEKFSRYKTLRKKDRQAAKKGAM
jgi:hypothetical protein